MGAPESVPPRPAGCPAGPAGCRRQSAPPRSSSSSSSLSARASPRTPRRFSLMIHWVEGPLQAHGERGGVDGVGCMVQGQREAPARPAPDIAANLRGVRERIAVAARAAGRDPGAVTLVAVSKTMPAPVVAEAVLAGVDVL